MIIVSLSILSLSVAGMPVRLILLLRCCRVLRIFGKLPSVAKIFAALFQSLVPMTNAFFIIFVIAAICEPSCTHSRIAIRNFESKAACFIAPIISFSGGLLC